jgi:phosphoglycolate phosphatase
MVGDTTFDMEMACAAGAGALGVGWGYHSVDELREAGAHAVIAGCHDLTAGIDAYFSRQEKAA